MSTDSHSQPDSPAADTTPESPPPSPKPPRGPALWIITTVLLVAVLAFAGGTFFGPAALEQAQDMITMATGRSDAHTHGDHDNTDNKTNSFYTCGMHPWVVLPDPGLCPICRMDLTPLDPDKFTGKISIDPIMAQNIGVRIQPVISGPVVRTIRTVGTITYDETRMRDVSIKVPGWIESLFVDYEGIAVEAGQPLFEFYSPKLYSAQSEYLAVLSMRDQGPAAVASGLDIERLIDAARVQLEFYGITTEQIARLERAGEPTKTMPILSPFSGIVIAKHANEGMRVEPGMRVFQIADLSKVWVQVSLYEYQLPFLQEGQLAEMTLPYIPGQRFNGRVAYIYPYLDETSRQVTVRLEFDNPSGLLKPGMFASVELKSTLARDRTQAPRSAIIDTGERQIAFVSLGEGKFEPRDVIMGVQTDNDMVEILQGLKPGEMVVTSGQFLLDSEARIREGLAKMVKGELAGEQSMTVAVADTSELTSLPEPMRTELAALLDSYLTISDTLASDSTDSITAPARRIASAVDAMLEVEIPDAPHFWHQHDEIAIVRSKALELASASTIEEARLAFADLSIALTTLTKATGVPVGFDSEIQELHCPMYLDGQGGSRWLQRAGAVRNPYFGSVMLECFDERSALPTTGQQESSDAPAVGEVP